MTRQQERLIRRNGGVRTATVRQPRSTSIAERNRWTGKPHEHKREIARRERQSA